MTIVARGPDGYHHPSTEAELQDLVARAHGERRQLRVLGAAHSYPMSIHTDGYRHGKPPPDGAFEVMLDRYRGITFAPAGDPGGALVEVEAGCHLGRDPYDPARSSTWDNSLNVALERRGLALAELSGISHQTIAGYLSTGSSGGSLVHSVHDQVVRLRLIDGTGTMHDVSRDDPDPAKRDLFHAAGVSMGLLGVISKVWLRPEPTFNITGHEVTGPVEDAEVDLFGPGIAELLREAPYARILWWPQRGFRRAQVWQAERAAPSPDFEPKPFRMFGDQPRLASFAGSLLYTIIGNLDDIRAVPGKLEPWFARLDADLDGAPDVNACAPLPDAGRRYTLDDVLSRLQGDLEGALSRSSPLARAGVAVRSAAHALAAAIDDGAPGGLPAALATAITDLVRRLLTGALESRAAELMARVLAELMPYLIDELLARFVTDGRQEFRDTWRCGLPMDNQMDSKLWPTSFTELWIPIEQGAAALRRLAEHFDAGGDPELAYARTGSFSFEIYGAGESPFWLSPSHGGPALRVNAFWFRRNAADPRETLFRELWDLLRPFGFRPHWGKHLPPPSDAWRAHYRRHIPKLEEFLKLRAALDPRQVFATRYWQEHLGIPPLG